MSERCGQLLAVDNDVLLYDVTSTYFEGQADANPQAQRGYSRDHRPDCAQVLIALVVTFDGFPLGYEVFAGNTLRYLPAYSPDMNPIEKAFSKLKASDRQ